MKFKATTLILGLCLAVLAVAPSPAYARSTTGFSAFHVYPKNSPNNLACLSEFFGAVVNNCTHSVGLEFDLPVDNAGTKKVQVLNYWDGTDAQESFSCGAYAYNGNGTIVNGSPINFTKPNQTLTSAVTLTSGGAIQVTCTDIPPGGGVALINWNQ